MSRFKRQVKGAISIFLVIILVSNYALVGLLVDSGRQRMAKASAEMALDTAAASVLSYYDQMIYDLYGLFATDGLTKEKIEELLSQYVESSLVTTTVNKSEAKLLTDTIVGALFGSSENGGNAGMLFDGYHYQFAEPTVSVNTDNTLSLAYTDVVEAQIIDHMKYRAPKALADEMGGFLENLKVLIEMKDRISAAIEKEKNTKDTKAELTNRGAELAQKIQEYNKKVLVFSGSGYEIFPNQQSQSYDSLKLSHPTPYDSWETIDKLDEKFNEIANRYDFVDEEDEFDEADEAALRRDYEREYQKFLQEWQGIGDIAGRLYEEANQLRDEAQRLNDDYKIYIAGMQAKIDADSGNEDIKTLYGPEIELAQSTCGEVLKNMNLVLIGRQYTKDLRDAFTAGKGGLSGFTDNFIEGAVSYVIDVHLGNNPEAKYASLRSYINMDASVFAQEAKEGMDSLTKDFEELHSDATSFEAEKEVTLQTKSANATPETQKPDEEKLELEDLKEDDLKVAFKNSEDIDQDWKCELSDEMDMENTLALLTAGLNLLEKIESALENARDSLYINEYIIASFPNYVQHYNATDSDLAKKAANKVLIASDSYYAPFNASLAEVEYILSGNPDTSVSVLSMGAKLTAVRMMFNTVAIMTDTAKVTQANSLAAAISGPFAPLVAAALLIAWALAESVSDALDLQQGKEVVIFKQGADWTFSLEGGMKKVIEGVAEFVEDEVTSAINDQIDKGSAAVSTIANKAAYDAYQAVDQASGNAIAEAKESMHGWVSTLQKDMEQNGVPGNAFASQANGAIDSAFGGVSSTLEDARDKAIVQMNNGIQKAEKTLKDKADSMVDTYGEQFSTWASESTSKYFELGNSVNTGSSTSEDGKTLKPTMDYVDYLRIFLLFYDNTYKVQRIQELVQANVRHGAEKKGIDSHKAFAMEQAYASVTAELDCTIGFMFMSNAILPASLKQDGGMKVSANTNLSY